MLKKTIYSVCCAAAVMGGSTQVSCSEAAKEMPREQSSSTQLNKTAAVISGSAQVSYGEAAQATQREQPSSAKLNKMRYLSDRKYTLRIYYNLIAGQALYYENLNDGIEFVDDASDQTSELLNYYHIVPQEGYDL